MSEGNVCRHTRQKEPTVAVEGYLDASGAVVPTNGDSGYETGCVFRHTDGGAGTALYVNEGSITSCLFVANASSSVVTATTLSNVPVANTATSDGLTTGIIADNGNIQTINVTSAAAANIVVLPTPVAGKQITLSVGSNGYELRSSAPATVAIGGGTGATVESAIPADSVCVMTCISATAWVGYTVTAATLAAVEAAA